MDGEEADRHAGCHRGETAEDSGLRAARVQDLGPLASEESDQLDQAGEIAHRIDRPPDVLQRDETRSRSRRLLDERALPVGGEHDVVALGKRREERGHIGLGAADLGQGDHQEDSWTRGRARHGAERTEA